ncbi:MAG: hypothetical protein A3J27_00090 [Candidatus Tectomicrobia bacterium RIFCSPLOWO2_12_FULL_69_37]|nr:MAG: hypothetical protein A3J27_00090 [Candidatus Tectomicrobia bacterium RIFCSPLOWO2_12_FULL_69_37]OGL63478.1 MAG: hypothetical protein A3I72_07910 [Candidatus Tectomicrobia bacterium RIFCSPLOWO2_02_FULL_70_19]
MEGGLRIPLSRILDEGLDIDIEVETGDLALEEGSWPPLRGVRLIGRIERTGPSEAVFRGRALGMFGMQCSLGLAEFDFPVDEPVVAYFVPRPDVAGADGEDEVELEEGDLEVAYLENETLDLAPPLRDQLGLAIPLQPKCPGKCLGENPEMCRRLEAGEHIGDEQAADPRWSVLREWRK